VWRELTSYSRSPGAKDDLPHLPAFVKEVFRWRFVARIGGTAHVSTCDDTWNGYHIPKGTWIQGHVRAIHHNEREFPDPDRFEPKKFLSGSEWDCQYSGKRKGI
jgi:cytochrome P450